MICHPMTPCSVIDSLDCAVDSTSDKLCLKYTLTGDLAAINLDSNKPSQQDDALWKHTCFEVFICPQGQTRYYEYNFALPQRWASYSFSDYRESVNWQADNSPIISSTIEQDTLQMEVNLHLSEILSISQTDKLVLGLSAVIEEVNGDKSYWALKHPTTFPDFHHKNGFIYELWS